MDKYHVKLTFDEPILGTVPKDPEIYSSYIAGKAAPPLDESKLNEELETVEHVEEKGWTGFHKKDDSPILYDYVIKGFFKDACSMLRRVTGSSSSKMKAHKKIIDGLVFVEPRQIPITVNGEVEVLERPLRAQTAQGERIALARSDTCPAGSTIEFDVVILGGVSQGVLTDWLDYGSMRGLGQWRNAGYGKFRYTIEKL